MPWIERVEANDVEGLFRKSAFIVLQHLIHVFIVTPTQHQVFQAHIWLVHATLCVVVWVVAIWIADEALISINNVIRPLTAHHECVANNSPLRLA